MFCCYVLTNTIDFHVGSHIGKLYTAFFGFNIWIKLKPDQMISKWIPGNQIFHSYRNMDILSSIIYTCTCIANWQNLLKRFKLSKLYRNNVIPCKSSWPLFIQHSKVPLYMLKVFTRFRSLLNVSVLSNCNQ